MGNTETVVKRDERRGAPSPGFDSVIVPGRPLPPAAGRQPSGRAGGFGEDYLLFDGSQVRGTGRVRVGVGVGVGTISSSTAAR